MEKRIKTYVIMVSLTYPVYHPRKKQPTYFIEKIQLALNMLVQMPGDLLIDVDPKIHTFRGNYSLWENRIKEVLAGNAVIVLKYHSLGRYVKGNKQIEFARLDKDSGVGIEEIRFITHSVVSPNLIIRKGKKKPKGKFLSITEMSRNDGLEFIDYKNWFEKGDYDMKESFACIHFTPFRYEDKT